MNKYDDSREFRDSQNELDRFVDEVKINIDDESALIRILRDASYNTIEAAIDTIDTFDILDCFESKDKIIKLFKDELEFRNIEY